MCRGLSSCQVQSIIFLPILLYYLTIMFITEKLIMLDLFFFFSWVLDHSFGVF